MRQVLAMASGPDASTATPPVRDPGAPIPKDEIDPELISLRPRTQVGLLTAFALVGFSVYLAIRLWPDFQYAGEGAARAVTLDQIAAGQVDDESHVSVRVELERAAAVRVRQSNADPGLRLAPALGAGDRVWVAVEGSGWAPPRESGRYTGRLRRLSELPFADAFRAQVAKHPPTRFITSDELRRGRATAVTTLATIGGDQIAIDAADPLEVAIDDPNAVTVVGSFTERQPDDAAWTKALADAGLVAAGTAPRASDEWQVWFEVRSPGALANTGKALEKAGLWGARVEPIKVHHTARWDAIGFESDQLRFGDVLLPSSAVDVVAIRAPRPLPSDPWLLVAGDQPGAYWYVRPLYGVIGLFGLLFAWALFRTARRELFSPTAPTRA